MRKILKRFYNVAEFLLELAFLALLFRLFPKADLNAVSFALDGIVMLGVLFGTIVYIRTKKRARKEPDENAEEERP